MTTWKLAGSGVYNSRDASWSASYVALTTGNYDLGNPQKGFAFAFSGQPRDRTPTRTNPGEFGARASKLYELLSEGHYDVKLTPEELKQITFWLDCNSDFYGAHIDLEKQAEGEVVQPSIE